VSTVASSTVPAADGGSISSGPFLWVLGALALIGAWAWFMPRIVRAAARRRVHSPPDRVAAAWRRSCGVLRLVGAPAAGGTTPIEYSRIVEEQVGIGWHVFNELARTVTLAVYAPTGVDESTAQRSEMLEQQIDEICQPRFPVPTASWLASTPGSPARPAEVPRRLARATWSDGESGQRSCWLRVCERCSPRPTGCGRSR